MKNFCVNWIIDKEIPTNLKPTLSISRAHHVNSIKTSMKKNLIYNSANLFSNPPFKNAICSGKKVYYIRLCTFLKIMRKKKMSLAASLAMITILFSSLCIFSHTFSSGLSSKKINTAKQIHNRTCFDLTIL